ncbi:SidA/IucD/PvdA family monooxygenase [Gordonia sp. (in: high G+C Gram-positive bacteria)]|uniref:SidA/IucD/PvdA family monooxygenase n=1 Tax=unclassified Gordonia (in: high G+C Gram-positive bacteria) TaxID=2657482 RepID=UPI002639A58A|nr:SidA/IucD/PvdA family monooxygenase [Gordonia sp. (in: high G+C Gram-positive bacteria)]
MSVPPGCGTLLVLGAGPKGVAVAAKARVLAELGLPAPRVVLIDQHTIGANWLPLGGWTDGRHRLGTSPEKDIGFPYRGGPDRASAAELNRRMLDYSWMSFLVEHGTYAEWVDRGRPHPHHHVWARYLEWAARRAGAESIRGEVTQIDTAGGSWRLRYTGGDGTTAEVTGDGLMITGPGSSAEAMLDDPRMLSVARFWELAAQRAIPASSRAAVIGGGETAGSVLDELARHDIMTVSAIAPGATIYTRGESYFENAVFSDPTGWPSLSAAERRDVIRRTDRGVFSVRVQENLLGDNRIHHVRGRVTRARADGDRIVLVLENDGHAPVEHSFDLVVDATGGRPLWFLELFSAAAADLLELALRARPRTETVEHAIGHDLAVIELDPPLYLPNLAGFAQGPGFPNLSCLGELSNRVLRGARQRSGAADPASVTAGSGAR